MMESQLVKRKFIPNRLFAGLGMIIIGLVIILIFNLVGVMPKMILIGGGLAIPIGVLVALQSFGKICLACNQPLKIKSHSLSSESKVIFKSILQNGNVSEMTKLLQGNKSANIFTQLEFKYSFCEKCRSVIEIKVTGWGSKLFSGEEVKKLLEIISPAK